MRLTTIAGVLLMCLASPAVAAMSTSFQWGPTGKCFDSKSPPMSFSGIPDGTVKLDIRMIDLNAPDYNHGGARIDYSGQKSLPYGAFRYRGPCPPTPHKYRFTIKALDAKGKVLAKAAVAKTFP